MPPRGDLGDAEFVRADIRNPVIAKVIAQAEVDTVVHMAVLATPVDAGGRATMKEINVIGTMQLLAACQKAPSVRKLVVKSLDRGLRLVAAGPGDVHRGHRAATRWPRTGYAKDSVEVEGYVRGFARRRPDVAVTTLRFANFVGPKVTHPADRPTSRCPSCRRCSASTPGCSSCTSTTASRCSGASTLGDHGGTFNVAGDGVLTLSQAIRRAGRPSIPLPQPAAPWIGQVLRRLGVADFSPEQMRFLSYGRVVDTTRMKDVLGFTPRYSTREAFDDFVARQGLHGPLSADVVGAVEDRVNDVLGAVSSRSGGIKAVSMPDARVIPIGAATTGRAGPRPRTRWPRVRPAPPANGLAAGPAHRCSTVTPRPGRGRRTRAAGPPAYRPKKAAPPPATPSAGAGRDRARRAGDRRAPRPPPRCCPSGSARWRRPWPSSGAG